MKLNQTNKILNDVERTNIVTFNNVAMEFIEVAGKTYLARSISCYNLEVELAGKRTVINPRWFERTVEAEVESSNFWLLIAPDEVLLFNAETSEVEGAITETYNCLTMSERLAKL